MKKQLFLLLTIISSLNLYSQISFEKGYFINNLDQKVDCLIKNLGWNHNPTKFKYKLSENSEIKQETIKSVKEFGIYNISKYIRSIVKIDRSSESHNDLSYDRKPILEEEELFLKVLIEGKYNLYEYSGKNLERYFYNQKNLTIDQLIFKSYRSYNDEIIHKNEQFKQQLLNDLKCPHFKINRIQNLRYNRKDLLRFFIDYINCYNDNPINYVQKEKQDLFNLTLRPRLNNASLTMQHATAESRNIDFGNKTSIGFGLEAEFILPFNKNKWSILVEPTYRYYKSKNSVDADYVAGGRLTTEVTYNSIEIPIGLRHYFFINNNSKIFINTSFIPDLSLNPSLEATRENGTVFESFKIKPKPNFAFGLGYKYNNKYSLEVRYQTSRKILGHYFDPLWRVEYNNPLLIIFGYSLF
ncbi:tRNA modification GTPase [Flavivirga jejuensis]|uniref:tRNA modification GTPase n=1 Tax=Flavivirga jejuensis TaxID=870487 RepID=A0ABT8WT92_9FLAO|nr:tRNA modification GTPase [Flavivirga jejuensis]MDO5976400.1 tRNA modification GTPase [Flavivirga jejuensis]